MYLKIMSTKLYNSCNAFIERKFNFRLKFRWFGTLYKQCTYSCLILHGMQPYVLLCLIICSYVHCTYTLILIIQELVS